MHVIHIIDLCAFTWYPVHLGCCENFASVYMPLCALSLFEFPVHFTLRLLCLHLYKVMEYVIYKLYSVLKRSFNFAELHVVLVMVCKHIISNAQIEDKTVQTVHLNFMYNMYSTICSKKSTAVHNSCMEYVIL